MCDSLFDANSAINKGEVAGLIVSASEYDKSLDILTRNFHNKVGCIPEFISVLCDEPSPRFLVSIFEFGLETIFRFENSLQEIPGWVKRNYGNTFTRRFN